MTKVVAMHDGDIMEMKYADSINDTVDVDGYIQQVADIVSAHVGMSGISLVESLAEARACLGKMDVDIGFLVRGHRMRNVSWSCDPIRIPAYLEVDVLLSGIDSFYATDPEEWIEKDISFTVFEETANKDCY